MKEIIEMTEKGIEILKKMVALSDALETINALLSENGLLEFIKHHRSLPRELNAKSHRELLEKLGNHAFDSYSDEKLIEHFLRSSGLDNHQEKENKFKELINGKVGSQIRNALGLAGFADDSLLDPIHNPDTLSALLESLESIFRCLRYEMRWPGRGLPK